MGGVDCDMFEVANEYLPYMLHGTRETCYCSCLMAAVMAGRSPRDAVVFAGDFTHDATTSAKQPDFKNRGVSFEPLLGKVAQLLGRSARPTA